MTDIAGGDTHVEDERLGLHFLGELDPAQSDEVHRHLQECADCRIKAGEVVDTLAALALDLPGDERPAGPADPPRHAAPPVKPPKQVAPPAGRPRAPTRPGGSRPRAASRTRRLWTSGVLLVLLLAVGGLGLSAIIRGAHDPGLAVLSASASGADEQTGATASLVATGDEDGLTVRVTAAGLTTGTGYVLYAVTSDGDTHEVTRWTGKGTVQPVEGRLPGEQVGDLSFVTISTTSGTNVVTVNLPRPSSGN